MSSIGAIVAVVHVGRSAGASDVGVRRSMLSIFCSHGMIPEATRDCLAWSSGEYFRSNGGFRLGIVSLLKCHRSIFDLLSIYLAIILLSTRWRMNGKDQNECTRIY